MYPRIKKEVMESEIKKTITINLEEKDNKKDTILYIEIYKKEDKRRITFPKSSLDNYEVIVK